MQTQQSAIPVPPRGGIYPPPLPPHYCSKPIMVPVPPVKHHAATKTDYLRYLLAFGALIIALILFFK